MNKISELSFEKFLGINTSEDESVSAENFAENSVEKNIVSEKSGTKIGGRTDTETNYSYAASEYDGLVKIFDRVSLTKDDTLVDIGCGMGRVLFFLQSEIYVSCDGN